MTFLAQIWSCLSNRRANKSYLTIHSRRDIFIQPTCVYKYLMQGGWFHSFGEWELVHCRIFCQHCDKIRSLLIRKQYLDIIAMQNDIANVRYKGSISKRSNRKAYHNSPKSCGTLVEKISPSDCFPDFKRTKCMRFSPIHIFRQKRLD